MLPTTISAVSRNALRLAGSVKMRWYHSVLKPQAHPGLIDDWVPKL